MFALRRMGRFFICSPNDDDRIIHHMSIATSNTYRSNVSDGSVFRSSVPNSKWLDTNIAMWNRLCQCVCVRVCVFMCVVQNNPVCRNSCYPWPNSNNMHILWISKRQFIYYFRTHGAWATGICICLCFSSAINSPMSTSIHVFHVATIKMYFLITAASATDLNRR